MIKASASLLDAAAQAAAAAPALSFFSEIEVAEKQLAEAGEFTGERLFRDRPEVYQEIIRLYAEKQGIRMIARICKVSVNTVYAVLEREPAAVETAKKRIINNLRKAAEIGSERMPEVMQELAADKLAVPLAITLDKLQLLTGEPTARVEKVEIRPDQVRMFLEQLPVIEAELIEDDRSTGICGETDGQKAPPALALPSPKSDMGSDVLAHDNSDGPADRATPRTTSLENTPLPGGGGGLPSSIPQSPLIESEKQNFGQRVCSAGDGSDTHPAVLGGVGRPVLATERGGAAGGPPAASDLCKATKKKQGGGPKRSSAKPSAVSTKAPITKKKKGGSAS
jgi:hypothetical protein